MEQVRTFIAIEISGDVRDYLAATQAELRKGVERAVKWVDPMGIHLTLKFLGNVPVPKLTAIEQELRASSPVSGNLPLRLILGTLGAFPSMRAPRVVWIGLRGDTERLMALQSAVEAALGRLGFSQETRPFAAHLTLGRARESISVEERRRLSESMTGLERIEALAFEAASIVVMRSQLTPRGAVYTPIATIGG